MIVLWLPEDRLRYEIIGGELYTTPTPPLVHQRVIGDLLTLVGNLIHDDRHATLLTYVAVKLGPHDIVTPDLIYGGPNRRLQGEEAVEEVPILIAEVLDERTRRRDLVLKAACYARCRVQEYWQVDPERRRFHVNVLAGPTYRRTSAEAGKVSSGVLPGLEIDLAELFSDRW